jgi:hypothetical protein
MAANPQNPKWRQLGQVRLLCPLRAGFGIEFCGLGRVQTGESSPGSQTKMTSSERVKPGTVPLWDGVVGCQRGGGEGGKRVPQESWLKRREREREEGRGERGRNSHNNNWFEEKNQTRKEGEVEGEKRGVSMSVEKKGGRPGVGSVRHQKRCGLEVRSLICLDSHPSTLTLTPSSVADWFAPPAPFSRARAPPSPSSLPHCLLARPLNCVVSPSAVA